MYGKPIEEAELRLSKARLVLGRVNYQETNDMAPDLVIYQSLEAGFSAVRGDTVNITLSRKSFGNGESLPW